MLCSPLGATDFVEVGPGRVLQGLNRRIDRTLSTRGIERFDQINIAGFNNIVFSADFGGVPNDWDASEGTVYVRLPEANAHFGKDHA